MKKIFLAVMIVCVMCSGSYAVSQDMSAYVRQDVFDAKMEMLLTRLEGKINALSERIDGLEKRIDARIDGLEKRIDARFDGLEKRTDARFDELDKRMNDGFNGLSKRIDDTHNFLYLLLVLFGAIFIIPSISKFWDFNKERKTPFTTVEDVRRIVSEVIAENNAKIRA